jgi:O-antigen/teichoic acid export membrane protein
MRHLPAAASVAVATGLVNVLGYTLTIVAARVLAAEEFGGFAALLSVIIVGNVAAMAVQAHVARSVASGRGTTPSLVLRSSVVLTAALLLSAPVLSRLLAIEASAVVAVAVSIGALTATAGPIGVAQGSERFVTLAGLLLMQGVLRAGGGLVGVLLMSNTTGAMSGIAAGLTAAAIVAWLAVPLSHHGRGKTEWRPVVRAASLLLGFVLMANVDVILARVVLDPEQSGAYGVGSIVTKVAFWLPQFIPVMAFARLSQRERHGSALRLALLAVVASGLVVVVATAVLAEPIVEVVAGEQYLPIAPLLWRFAVLGALFALAQVTVFSALARGDRTTTVLVWLALAALVLLVLPMDTVSLVVTAAVSVAAALVIVTGGREIRVGAHRLTVAEPAPGVVSRFD